MTLKFTCQHKFEWVKNAYIVLTFYGVKKPIKKNKLYSNCYTETLKKVNNRKIYNYISYVIAVRWIWYCRETSRSALCLIEHNPTPYNS